MQPKPQEIREPGPLTDEELALARQFVTEGRWTFAKTMPHIPHESNVKPKSRDSSPERWALFEWFVALILNQGYDRTWHPPENPKRSFTYRYFELDGYKYWTMGAGITATTIINREKLADG